MHSCWWPRVVVEICPSVSPRRMNSDSQAGHKGTPTSRSSKQSKAQRSAAQRPGEDRGRQPSPLGLDWKSLCVGKRRTDRQIGHPERPNAQAGFPPHQRHARSFPAQLSDLSPHRGALQPTQRRPAAGRNALGLTRHAPESGHHWAPKVLGPGAAPQVASTGTAQRPSSSAGTTCADHAAGK